jgi:hypothetical protein
MSEVVQPAEGQIVELKKGHPCGHNRWEVCRLGMDVKLRCLGCNHYVTLPRQRFMRRIKQTLPVVAREEESTEDAEGTG